MNVKIQKSTPCGKVTAPASKSMAHRILISAAMADGVSTVHGLSDCADVEATISCLEALGVQIERDGDDARVKGVDMRCTRKRRRYAMCNTSLCAQL